MLVFLTSDVETIQPQGVMKMKTQYLAIALLSSVVMSTVASASQTILTFEQIPGTTIGVDTPSDGSKDFFAPVFVSGPTFSGVFGEFELQLEPSGSQFDGFLFIPGETGIGGNGNGINYLEGIFKNEAQSGSTFTEDLINPFSSVGLIEDGLMRGKSEVVFSLSPTVSGSISVSGAPEPSTWAMMLLGFVGLGYVGYRKARVQQP